MSASATGSAPASIIFDDADLNERIEVATPEISWATGEAIASWQRVLGCTVGDKNNIFTRAAVEVLRLAEGEKPLVRQVIIDAVADMGASTGIGDEDVQTIMAMAMGAPRDGHSLNGSAREGGGNLPTSGIERPRPLNLFDPTEWEGQSVPPRRWLVPQRIPLANVTMLNGDGAAGKTAIALQLGVATVRGTDWLGSIIDTPGSVMFVTAEEDYDEIHRRLAAIIEHQRIGFRDLAGLHLLCMPGSDAVLGIQDRAGVIQPTALFESLTHEAACIRPSLIVIEAAADVFAGNENDRTQVRQFVALLRRLALSTGAAVLLIAHPSLSGLASGTGTSGSTAWNNSVRSRLYFTGAKKSDDDAKSDIRELKVMKSNYGPAGEIVRLRWRRGVFVPEGGPGTIERVAAEAAVDQAYLDCLDALHGSGRQVGPYAGRAYAPAIFEKMPQAKGFRAKALAVAQERMFSAGHIEVVKIGPPSKALDRIFRKATCEQG